MAAGGIGAATVPAVLAGSPAAAATAVDMELVLVAAMVDPPKSGTGTTLTAGPHVKVVEQALDVKNFLAASSVDGHYGTTTISAYSAYQKSLGYTGLDANGIPGPTSLTKLGSDTGLFTVTRAVNVGSSTDSAAAGGSTPAPRTCSRPPTPSSPGASRSPKARTPPATRTRPGRTTAAESSTSASAA
jgi:hypothetical protein